MTPFVRGERRALVAAALLLLFNVWHLTNRGSWTGSLGDSLTLGPAIRDFGARVDPALRVFKPYDGQYYYAIAFDPWLSTRAAVPLLDDPAYRYRRMLLPTLASALALGEPRRLPATLLIVNVAAWLACGALAWRLARRDGLPALGLAFGTLVTTGLVYSAFRTLPEPLSLALTLGGLLAHRQGRLALAGSLLGGAALAREESLLVTITLLLFAKFAEGRSVRDLVPLAALASLPALLWWGYLGLVLPPAATALGSRISWPFVGLVRESLAAFELNRTQTNLLRSLSVDAVALWLCLEAFLGLRRAPTLWGALVVAQALLCSTLRGDIWNYWAGSARVIVPLSVFSLFRFFERARGGPEELENDFGQIAPPAPDTATFQTSGQATRPTPAATSGPRLPPSGRGSHSRGRASVSAGSPSGDSRPTPARRSPSASAAPGASTTCNRSPARRTVSPPTT